MKKFLAILLMTILAFSLVGCGSEPEAEDGLEDFTIVLDWYPNAIHTFLYVAQEKGYFAEEGLNLVVNFPANTNDGISMPAVGRADLGIYYLQDVILTAVEEDVPIVSIGSVVQESLNVVIAMEKTGIKTPADLAGKKIGYAGTALSEAQVKCMLENAGVPADEYELIDVGFDLLLAAYTGQVDATIGNMINHEVPQLEKQDLKISYFRPVDHGVPMYYELVFLAGRDAVENNPEKLQRFLRAAQKGFDFMQENPEEALEILLDCQNAENFPLIPSVEEASMEVLLPLMEQEGAPFMTQDISVWQENADWLYEMGLLSEKADVSGMVADLLAE